MDCTVDVGDRHCGRDFAFHGARGLDGPREDSFNELRGACDAPRAKRGKSKPVR
jgi:hypothetical protein